MSSEFVAAMETVLDVYAEPYQVDEPVICFDERPVQLHDHVVEPLPPQPGRASRFDYQYERKGTANLFMMCQPLAGWRTIIVTTNRRKVDFAQCMRALVDQHFPHAHRIRVVLDNLNTHTIGALYQAFKPEEARRIARKITLIYTPKHGSWLNMAEIELAVLSRQTLQQRIPSISQLESMSNHWTKRRNAAQTKINWTFNVEHARHKLRHLYP